MIVAIHARQTALIVFLLLTTSFLTGCRSNSVDVRTTDPVTVGEYAIDHRPLMNCVEKGIRRGDWPFGQPIVNVSDDTIDVWAFRSPLFELSFLPNSSGTRVEYRRRLQGGHGTETQARAIVDRCGKMLKVEP